ncbi:MAG: hypothetical protein GXY52_01305 [Chloroflexi bacterium]|nr:hypothetical protein [Chloroflexota bacterium]
MPAGGFYHDSIERQAPYAPESLDPEVWVDEMYHVFREDELRLLEGRARTLYEGTTRAIIGNFPGAGFGDIAHVPAPAVAHPRGSRMVYGDSALPGIHPRHL